MDAIKHFHPAVGFCFFTLMIVISLASMQPVFQVVSFVAVVSYAISISGLKGFIRGNWWVVILIIVVTVFNFLLGAKGLSVIFTLDLGFIHSPVTVESFVYGIIMGLMLANVILWFNVLGKLSSLHGFIELFSKFSPTAGMMVARITVFIPELLAQAKMVDRAQQTFAIEPAASAESGFVPTDGKSKRQRKGQLAYGATLSSHLMEWGMEKSLITANSMVARGYGSRKRTSYRRTRLALRDVIPLVWILALGLGSLVAAIVASVNYEFYPYLSEIQFWWGYAPFVLLCLVPLILQVGEELAWWRSR